MRSSHKKQTINKHQKLYKATKMINTKNSLTNEDYLKRTLKLLDLPQNDYLKYTKLKFSDEPIFPKNQVNPASSKPFFYIANFCCLHILREQQLGQITMWYPPRNVSQQLQYKKVLWKIIQQLQNSGRIPKNILLSKNSIMGDIKADQLLEFLRFFAELALRQSYIDRFSHRDKLVQITSPGYSYPVNTLQNNINRFYSYPFVPSQSISQNQLPHNIQSLLNETIKIYKYHIRNYTQKISKLRLNTSLTQLQLPHQQIICKLTEQKQLYETLRIKIPEKILSQNRAFDRRRIIEQNQEIWNNFNQRQWLDLQKRESSVLEATGQIDEVLKKWNTVKGTANIIEANSIMSSKLTEIKQKYKNSQQKFEQLKLTLNKMILK